MPKIRAVYQIKIHLIDSEPPIWRRIQVWEDTELPRLHMILQVCHNWENYHLHQFVAGKRTYSVPDPEFDGLSEFGVKVRDVFDSAGSRIRYDYDFGDSWQHELLLEAILIPEEGAKYPRCVAGKRNGPPEDVGGVEEYERYIEILADPRDGEHWERREWRGFWRSEEFSLDVINERLASLRSGARKIPPRLAPVAGHGGLAMKWPLTLDERERELVLHGLVLEAGFKAVLKRWLADGNRLQLDAEALTVLARAVHNELVHCADPWIDPFYGRIMALLDQDRAGGDLLVPC